MSKHEQVDWTTEKIETFLELSNPIMTDKEREIFLMHVKHEPRSKIAMVTGYEITTIDKKLVRIKHIYDRVRVLAPEILPERRVK